jgi:hypothetical protein
MSEQTFAGVGTAGNGGPGTAVPSEVCDVCPSKEIVSGDEHAILGHMREIKEQVRRLTQRMNEIKAPEGAAMTGGDGREDRSEWNELFATLEDLRSQWSDWQRRLDEAIERKLIALGHREP